MGGTLRPNGRRTAIQGKLTRPIGIKAAVHEKAGRKARLPTAMGGVDPTARPAAAPGCRTGCAGRRGCRPARPAGRSPRERHDGAGHVALRVGDELVDLLEGPVAALALQRSRVVEAFVRGLRDGRRRHRGSGRPCSARPFRRCGRRRTSWPHSGPWRDRPWRGGPGEARPGPPQGRRGAAAGSGAGRS